MKAEEVKINKFFITILFTLEKCNSTKGTTKTSTVTTTTTTTTATTTTAATTTKLPTTSSTTTSASYPETGSSPSYSGQIDVVHHDFICHMNTLEVFIPASVVPNSKLWMKDPSCVLTNNGSHHVLTVPYDQCGTNVGYFTEYLDINTDITVHTDIQADAPVVFGDDYTIHLACRVPRHAEIDGSFQAVTRDPIQEVGGNADLGFHLKEYTSSDYSHEITRYPVQVPVNKEVFLEVTLTDVTSKNDTAGVKVNECRATPTANAQDSTSFLLVKDGCPATHAVHLQPSPGPGTYRFSLQTFHFSGSVNHDDVVYIHCDVGVCTPGPCFNSCGSRRRRRTAARRSEAATTLTSGPHIILH
ncbi:hypothetical protein Btru_077619 [Bulinus truncatus]|nr:hypothetical protein Btru_077619 [Bulinus truncatus]